MELSSDAIKASVAAYFRYSRQCPLVAFEASAGYIEKADVMVVTKDRHLLVVEVKTSLSDFRKDGKKACHRHYKDDSGLYPTAYFYFAVPLALAGTVSSLCDQLFPYAGVIGCNRLSEYGIAFYRKPRRLKGKRLTLKQVVYMARSQAATLCRLARKVEEQRRIIANMRGEKFEMPERSGKE